MRLTDVADQQQLFRLIQSIPSPKAEPFKLWMAQVASHRIDQIQDPELCKDNHNSFPVSYPPQTGTTVNSVH